MSKDYTLSKIAIDDLIIEPEVSSKLNYNLNLTRPVWPRNLSGVTIGLGYDIGYKTAKQLREDLTGILSPADIELLVPLCGKVGRICKSLLPNPVIVTWGMAQALFYKVSLPEYVKQAGQAFDELETLHPYEQTAITGLVYNRGNSTKIDKDNRRLEMNKLIKAVRDDNDQLMASLIRQMKRLWKEDQRGLLLRREKEAQYIEKVDTPIPDSDKLIIRV